MSDLEGINVIVMCASSPERITDVEVWPMNPFWIETIAVTTATGVIATVLEHRRKFTENPGACWPRGAFFIIAGLVGMAISFPETISGVNGFTPGFFVPFILGFAFLGTSLRTPDTEAETKRLEKRELELEKVRIIASVYKESKDAELVKKYPFASWPE
jgi:hypothetical protein